MNSIYAYQVLNVVAETGKLSTAAELLHLTPSAVSHAIQGLEDEFGFAIFERTRTGVRLTGAGETILPHVRSILREQEGLLQKKSEILGLHEGSVRIGTFYSVTMNWLVGILSSFKAKNPGVDIEILEGGYQDTMRWIAQNMVDLTFVSDSMQVSSYLPLYKDQLLCVVPPDFCIPQCGYLNAADLKGRTLILQEDGEDMDFADILKDISGLSPKKRYIIEDDNCIMAMVEAGMGIAFMGSLACKRRIAHVKIVPFRPAAYRTVGIYCPNSRTMSPAARAMQKCIVEYISALKGKEGEDIVLC